MGGFTAAWRDFHADRRRLAWSSLWFFLVLFAYYCIKPLRDALGTNLSHDLGKIYLATFVATLIALALYSWLVSRISRRRLLIAVHGFFVACLLVFYALIPDLEKCSWGMSAVFFVWVSVFNLNVVTLFWSVMADLFQERDAKKWFGLLAAAGSIGSVCGSLLAGWISTIADARQLMLLSVLALGLAVVVGLRLLHVITIQESRSTVQADRGTGGNWIAGLTHVFKSPYLLAICGFVVLGKFAATFIYNFLQIQLQNEAISAQDRTELFSQINLYSQLGTLMLQGVVVRLVIRYAGIAAALMAPCLVYVVLFTWVGLESTGVVLAWCHVIQQIVSYGILVPSQHVLFTVVSREDKYKAKGFIDTVVFRGSDVLAGNACDTLIKLGATVSRIANGMTMVALIWLSLGFVLGLSFRQKSSDARSAG